MVEVWRHLEHADQSADSIVIGLESLIENSDTVPKLRIVHIFNRVKSMLIGCESLVNILREEIAVTKGGPRGTIVRIMSDQLSIVLDGLLVITARRTELSHLAEARDRLNVPLLVW